MSSMEMKYREAQMVVSGFWLGESRKEREYMRNKTGGKGHVPGKWAREVFRIHFISLFLPCFFPIYSTLMKSNKIK